MILLMETITISPCIYVLKLEDDCFYVGITYNLNQRLGQHYAGNGSIWTRLHKPIELMRVIYPASGKEQEDDITLEMMAIYGMDKVRGGMYCREKLPKKYTAECQID